MMCDDDLWSQVDFGGKLSSSTAQPAAAAASIETSSVTGLSVTVLVHDADVSDKLLVDDCRL